MATLRSNSRRAFSLVESVMVVAIIAVFAAVVGPRYANSLALYRAQAAALRVAADLNLARWQARAGSAGQTVNFTATGYAMPNFTGPSGYGTPYTVDLTAEPYKAKLTAGNTASLAFDRYGQPSAGGTFTVQSGVATRTVTLDPVTGLAAAQ